MSLDLEGVGQMVIRSNDWKTDKCVPDLIYAQNWQNTDEKNTIVWAKAESKKKKALNNQLKDLNYTVLQDIGTNSLLIHNSKLDFYRKEATKNAQILSNSIFIKWNEFCTEALSKLLKKSCNPFMNVKKEPYFLYVKQTDIIDIDQINRYSNLMSSVGKNRPIIIMQYDHLISKLKLFHQNYTVSDVKVLKNYLFKQIKAFSEGKQILVYVFDHQKHPKLTLQFLNSQQTQPQIPNKASLVSNPAPSSEKDLQLIQKQLSEIKKWISADKKDNENSQFIEKRFTQIKTQIKSQLSEEKKDSLKNADLIHKELSQIKKDLSSNKEDLKNIGSIRKELTEIKKQMISEKKEFKSFDQVQKQQIPHKNQQSKDSTDSHTYNFLEKIIIALTVCLVLLVLVVIKIYKRLMTTQKEGLKNTEFSLQNSSVEIQTKQDI